MPTGPIPGRRRARPGRAVPCSSRPAPQRGRVSRGQPEVVLRQRDGVAPARPGRAAVLDTVLQDVGLVRADPQGGPLGGGDVIDGGFAERDAGAVQERLAEQSVAGGVGAGVALPDGRVEFDDVRPLGRRCVPDMPPLRISMERASQATRFRGIGETEGSQVARTVGPAPGHVQKGMPVTHVLDVRVLRAVEFIRGDSYPLLDENALWDVCRIGVAEQFADLLLDWLDLIFAGALP